MAGFEVITYGRFWVTAEARMDAKKMEGGGNRYIHLQPKGKMEIPVKAHTHGLSFELGRGCGQMPSMVPKCHVVPQMCH